MQWCAVSEARAEVKQKRQHHPVGIHCFAQGCLYRFAKHHKCDANAFAVHTSQLRGTHFGMQMSYLMLQLTECCIIASVHQCICVSHKKRNYWKRGKIKREELYCFKVCCTSFSIHFLLVQSSWPATHLVVGFVSKQVYDGKDGAAQLLGTYTGVSMQGLFLTSTSNYLWLEFSSDQDTTAAGFRLTYYSKSHFITRGGGGGGGGGGP